jgi:hypothetical protein
MTVILSWLGAALLALFGVRSATGAFRDLISLVESGLEVFAWPIILGVCLLFALRMRRWRDQ